MTVEAQIIKIDLVDNTIDEYTDVNETSAMLDIKVGIKNDPQNRIIPFKAFVITPQNVRTWLKNPTDIISFRGYYLVEKINRETLHNVADYITDRINTTYAETWEEVSLELSWYVLGESELHP